jgi:hypothetical protein
MAAERDISIAQGGAGAVSCRMGMPPWFETVPRRCLIEGAQAGSRTRASGKVGSVRMQRKRCGDGNRFLAKASPDLTKTPLVTNLFTHSVVI